MPIKPLHDRVLVARTTAPDRTPGGIHIPENAKERPIEGRVVAVGPGRRNDHGDLVPMCVEPGNTIVFSKYSGTEIEMNGEKMLIMSEADILGIVT